LPLFEISSRSSLSLFALVRGNSAFSISHSTYFHLGRFDSPLREKAQKVLRAWPVCYPHLRRTISNEPSTNDQNNPPSPFPALSKKTIDTLIEQQDPAPPPSPSLYHSSYQQLIMAEFVRAQIFGTTFEITSRYVTRGTPKKRHFLRPRH